MSSRRRGDPTPLLVPKEESDPITAAIEAPLKRASDIAGWLKAIVALGVGLFVAGGASYMAFARVATKDDIKVAKSELATQFQAHTATPHAAVDGGPAINHRIDGLESRIDASEAKESANQWWIRESITALMRERGLRPPAVTPPPTVNNSFSPAR